MRSFKFLIYILTAFSILVLPADNTSFAATEYSQKNFLCNAVDGMKVILRSKYGDVTVHTWEQPRVRVSATITVDARNNNEAQEFIDRIDVKFKADSQKVEIISSIPRIPVIYEKEGFFDFLKGDSEIEVDIDIQIWVPARSDLDLETTKGEIVANGITGQIRASTTEEKIDLDNINGSVKAYTTESEITAKLLSLNMDDIELSTSNSDIELYVPEMSGITLQAKAIEGEIKSSFDVLKRGNYTNTTIFGWINNGGVNVKLYTRKGRINIKKS